MSKFNEKRMIDDIRLLSLDMIAQSGSGYPGIVLSAAPIVYALFANHMVYSLDRPDWANRDRFVLSSAKAAPLLYSTIYAATGDFDMNELKSYMTMNSITPGFPELNVERRIEVTGSTPGQGLANAVGMGIAERYLEEKYNTKKQEIFNYNIYCLCDDDDLMEGVSYEAATIAGECKLNNLVVLLNATGITADGELPEDYTEKLANMYVSLGWDVFVVKNGDKVSEIDKAIDSANRSKLPSLIIVNTILGKYSEYEDSNKIYTKLEKGDLAQIRTKLKGAGPFMVDEENILYFRKEIKARNGGVYQEWYQQYSTLTQNSSEKLVDELNEYLNDENIILNLDKVVDKEKLFLDKSMCDINFQIMNVISAFVDRFIGGSAGLTNQTKTYLKNGGDYSIEKPTGKNITFGHRENAMGGILNGLALSNFKPFGSTYLALADNLKPAIRNSAIMNLPVTYIFTHDSVRSFQEGKAYQPIEQLAMLRSIPNLEVYRPCDYKELLGAWQLILRNNKPAALVVAKNSTESYKFTSAEETELGGYVISEVKSRLDVILIASGSEVTLAMKLKQELLKNFIEARIVSMPDVDAFFRQSREYQNQVLPKGYKRMILEFSNDSGLHRLAKNESDIINIKTFGKSGSEEEILTEFELDIPNIIIKIKNNI